MSDSEPVGNQGMGVSGIRVHLCLKDSRFAGQAVTQLACAPLHFLVSKLSNGLLGMQVLVGNIRHLDYQLLQ